MVTTREMDSYWCKLSQAYMTEESDDPDNPESIIQHKLPWRSESKLIQFNVVTESLYVLLELNRYINVLDKRREKVGCRSSGLVAKKVRVLGHPSESQPPASAPSWAVQSKCEGCVVFILYTVLCYLITGTSTVDDMDRTIPQSPGSSPSWAIQSESEGFVSFYVFCTMSLYHYLQALILVLLLMM